DLREAIRRKFQDVVAGCAVNVSPAPKAVSYDRKLSAGDRIYVRVLGADGVKQPASGAYTVDPAKQLHLPLGGDIDASDLKLGDLDAGSGARVPPGVVGVSPDELS